MLLNDKDLQRTEELVKEFSKPEGQGHGGDVCSDECNICINALSDEFNDSICSNALSDKCNICINALSDEFNICMNALSVEFNVYINVLVLSLICMCVNVSMVSSVYVLMHCAEFIIFINASGWS